MTETGIKRRREEDDDDEHNKLNNESSAKNNDSTIKSSKSENEAEQQEKPRQQEEEEEEEEEEEDDDDEEEDDDSDVEFILGPREETVQTPAAPAVQAEAQPALETKESNTDTPAEASTEASANTLPAEQPQRGTLDIDAVGTYNGQPISHFPPSSFEEKPWRRPGADISDYFNYGFDEFTWMAYCSRQDKLRAHFTPQQVMQSMPMNPMGAGMPMPPFMMPPMMFPPPPSQ